MSVEKSRILIIGAGVNGSAIAAEFFRVGIDVTVLARGNRFEELSQEGILIENPFSGKRSVTRLPLTDHLPPDDRYDYILVLVRKNQTFDLLPTLAQNQSPNIVFMGNNLAGPGEFVKTLGRERVMMGSVFAAGRREGSLIRAMVIKSVASPLGEIDGAITPRLHRLANIFRQAGFRVELSTDIVATQRTHGVGVAIIALLVMKHGGSVRLLANAADDLKLYVAARREGIRVLRALGYRVLPPIEVFLTSLPVFLQVIATRLLLRSRLGMVGLEYHISQAPDEMQQLGQELRDLVDQSGLSVPALRKVLS